MGEPSIRTTISAALHQSGVQQSDNVTIQEWLQDKSLNVFEWPSQSPVLNPVEHLERPENSCEATLPIQPDRA
jgi:hypothetical protein